jgi:hypothetical protein
MKLGVYTMAPEPVSTAYFINVVLVDKLSWIFVVRADKIKPLFTPKV